MSEDRLKPCPFCGSRVMRVKRSDKWGWFVSCTCAAVGPGAHTRNDAIAAWNTRTGSDVFDDVMKDWMAGVQ